MLSKWQKLLYNMSMFSPFFLLWNGWEYWQNCTLSTFAKISIVLNFLFIIWYYFCFNRLIKKTNAETIKVEAFNPSDIKVFDLALQVFPIIIGFIDVAFGVAVYIIMIIYMTKSNLNFVSPLLFLHKPNLYEISIANGGGTCLLATKQEIKNVSEITKAKYIFTYFYIDD